MSDKVASDSPIRFHLAEKILAAQNKWSNWFKEKASESPPPLYSSIDFRDSGFKVAPVDCNLYPAGFNNICSADLEKAPAHFKKQLSFQLPGDHPKAKVLLLPENNTQNQYYIENLIYLIDIIRGAGLDLKLGWYDPEFGTDPIELKGASGQSVVAHPITIENGEIRTQDFRPDWVLLNNDFSSGHPILLDTVKQPILPSHLLGWHSREKGKHFEFYNELAAEFSSLIDIDPRLISIRTETVDEVHFNEEQGVEKVAKSIESVLSETAKFYSDYGIKDRPYVFVKSNVGTYGMGIMTVRDPSEILALNRRKKNQMSTGKNRIEIRSVVVQEGVPTATIVNDMVAEPVIYLFGCDLVGGFLRSHSKQGREENLNYRGMVFQKLCMADLERLLEKGSPESFSEKTSLLELVYGSIARLSGLAAGRELSLNT